MFRGHNFRKDYSKLGTLSSVFPKARIIAMTATATKEYQTTIIQSLNMKDPKCVIANPDRANIFYKGPHILSKVTFTSLKKCFHP